MNKLVKATERIKALEGQVMDLNSFIFRLMRGEASFVFWNGEEGQWTGYNAETGERFSGVADREEALRLAALRPEDSERETWVTR